MKQGKHTDAHGTQIWYQNDRLHREDGPAIIHPNGTQKWCIHGKLHCETGPAIIWNTGKKEWYINDKRLTINEFKNYHIQQNLKTLL